MNNSIAQLRPKFYFTTSQSVQLFLVVDSRKLKTEALQISESHEYTKRKEKAGVLIGNRCTLHFSDWIQMVGDSRTHTQLNLSPIKLKEKV